MANYVHIIREEHITSEETIRVLNEINKEVFNGLLPIDQDLIDENKPNWFCIAMFGFHGVEMWVENGGIDIKHSGKMVHLYNWLEWVIMCELTLRLNAQVEDDGIGKIEFEDLKYKSFKDSLNRKSFGRGLLARVFFFFWRKDEIKKANKYLPKDLFNYIMNVK